MSIYTPKLRLCMSKFCNVLLQIVLLDEALECYDRSREWLHPAIAMFCCIETQICIQYIFFNAHAHCQCNLLTYMHTKRIPGSKVHGANMGCTWVLSAPDWPHVGSMNHAIRLCSYITADSAGVLITWTQTTQILYFLDILIDCIIIKNNHQGKLPWRSRRNNYVMNFAIL